MYIQSCSTTEGRTKVLISVLQQYGYLPLSIKAGIQVYTHSKHTIVKFMFIHCICIYEYYLCLIKLFNYIVHMIVIFDHLHEFLFHFSE